MVSIVPAAARIRGVASMNQENTTTTDSKGNGADVGSSTPADHTSAPRERLEPLAVATELPFGLGAIGVVWLGG